MLCLGDIFGFLGVDENDCIVEILIEVEINEIDLKLVECFDDL